MTSEKQISYYSIPLYVYHDTIITGNNLCITQFIYGDEYGLKPNKLKFAITNYQANVNLKFNLSYIDVFTLFLKLKPLSDDVNGVCNEIRKNKSIIKTISIKLTEHKQLLHLSLLYRNEFSDVCYRMSFIDENKNEIECKENIYLSIYAFLSLIKIIVQYRDNYVSYSNNMFLYVSNEINGEKIVKLEEKLDTIFQYIRQNKIENISLPKTIESYEKVKNEVIKEEIPVTENQNDLNSFITDNLDKIQLADIDVKLARDDHIAKVKEENFPIKEDKKTFTELILENNVERLENFLNLALTAKFTTPALNNVIERKYKEVYPDFEIYPGCSEKEKLICYYLSDRVVKYNFKKRLIDEQGLPQSINPISYEIKDFKKITDQNIDMMFDLFLYFIYFTCLKNVLKEEVTDVKKNKDATCFLLKCLLSPVVFSILSCNEYNKNLNRDAFVKELIRRYEKYLSGGVFDKLFEELKNITTKEKYNISLSMIAESSRKLLNGYLDNTEKFTLKNVYAKYKELKYLSLDFEDFEEEKIINIEQIIQYNELEYQYISSGKVEKYDENIFDLIPEDILRKIGIVKKGVICNTENLLRYVKDKVTDSKEQEFIIKNIVLKIKSTYLDLKDIKNISYTNFPEDVLKAICLWDINIDNKITTNYNYFIERIKSSSLNASMCIAILNNIQEIKTEQTFTNCLEITELKLN
jgi:hypothetical protein